MPEGWGVEADNLRRFRAAVAGALAHLESRREEVNDLNVFPVADGDTGDNMALTLRAVLEELDRLQIGNGSRPIDELGREEIVESVARAALLGARGNSGVILSQLIRGAAEELVSRPGELIDPALIGAALLNAANRAYSSVRDPAEGTILTVAREMAHQIVADVAHAADSTRLCPTTAASEQDAVIAGVLERALSVGRGLGQARSRAVADAARSRRRRRRRLRAHAALRRRRGGASRRRAAGARAPRAGARLAPGARVEHLPLLHQLRGHRARPAPGEFIGPLEELGDSVLVVGDSRTLKVHVHTDDPERATAVFADVGEVSHLDVADMRVQTAERSQRISHAEDAGSQQPAPPPGAPARPDSVRCAAVAVVNGDGFAELFAELGVHTIDGGPTLNPSTYQVLAGIHEVDAEEVVVLPCSANVMMAAERAAELSERQVAVVKVTSQQAALLAAVTLTPEHGVERNAHALAQTLTGVRTGAVAEAARDDRQGRFRQGEAVGFVEDEVVAWGDPAATLERVLSLLAEDAELVSVFAGAGAPLDEPATEAALDGRLADCELELRQGGQEAYWWLLAAE